MFKIESFKKDDGFEVRISGNAGVISSKKIYDELKRICGLINGNCSIDIKGIDSTDISFIQILLSYNKKLASEGKAVELIVGNDVNPVITMMGKTGIDTSHFKIRMEK